jgi:hypothetical protein
MQQRPRIEGGAGTESGDDHHEEDEGPILVVCPKSLVTNWQQVRRTAYLLTLFAEIAP